VTTHASDAELWAEIEQEWIDVVMVMGAAEAACRQMHAAKDELDKALVALERARKRAERAHAELTRWVSTAEDLLRFAAAVRGATKVI